MPKISSTKSIVTAPKMTSSGIPLFSSGDDDVPDPRYRSNFTDRMIDDVVRSTPSMAPMRSVN